MLHSRVCWEVDGFLGGGLEGEAEFPCYLDKSFQNCQIMQFCIGNTQLTWRMLVMGAGTVLFGVEYVWGHPML